MTCSTSKNYKSYLNSATPTKEVAKILGIGRKAVVDLIEHKCLSAFRGRTVDGYLRWLIYHDAPVELLNRIDALFKKKADRRKIEKCSFDSVIRRLSGSGCTIGRFVSAILDKTIVPVCKSKGTGLKQYCFNVRDVDRLVEEYFKGDEKFLTVLDIAILLGVKQQVAAFWIDRGFIEAEIEIHQHHRHRKVLRSSIEEFQAKYVTAVELARQMDTSSKKVISLLKEKNIFPISGKQIDGGRQYLFLKHQVVVFAVEVLREKPLNLETELQIEDFESFFNQKAEMHDELEALQPETKIRGQRTLFKMLREADLLSTENRIYPALPSASLINAVFLERQKEALFFPFLESQLGVGNW